MMSTIPNRHHKLRRVTLSQIIRESGIEPTVEQQQEIKHLAQRHDLQGMIGSLPPVITARGIEDLQEGRAMQIEDAGKDQNG
jgi:hypothetical protein